MEIPFPNHKSHASERTNEGTSELYANVNKQVIREFLPATIPTMETQNQAESASNMQRQKFLTDSPFRFQMMRCRIRSLTLSRCQSIVWKSSYLAGQPQRENGEISGMVSCQTRLSHLTSPHSTDFFVTRLDRFYSSNRSQFKLPYQFKRTRAYLNLTIS